MRATTKWAAAGTLAALVAAGGAGCGADDAAASGPADQADAGGTSHDVGTDGASDGGAGDTAATLESCSNLVDDDGDGLIDCDDPDCDRVNCGGPVACPDLDLAERVGYPAFTGSTRGAGHSGGGSCGGERGEDLHLLWTAPKTDNYTFSTRGSEIDTILYALDGDCDGEELDCNDDADASTLQSSLVLALEAGDTVVLVIDGYEVIGGNGGGGVRLNIVPEHLDAEAGFCGDGVDNDEDGAPDCLDDECDADPSCAPLSGATSLVSGGEHLCATLADGHLVCWGSGSYGQLGTGETGRRRRGAVLPTLSNVSTVAAGTYHTCAVDTDGTAWCWGAGWSGELGNGETLQQLLPTRPDLGPVVDVAAGASHSCALSAGGNVWCWGSNYSGQVNPSADNTLLTPTPVAGVSGVVQLSAGVQHTCARTDAGRVLCWGRGSDGQIGNGGVDARSAPADPGLADVIDVAAGGYHTCAITDGGTVWCWGRAYEGEVGQTRDVPVRTPFEVPFVGAAVDVDAGQYHSCAALTNGDVWCWGTNYYGETGPEAPGDTRTPHRIDGVTDAVAVVAGARHSCALRQDGTVACWGGDDRGQLGAGSAGLAPGPVRVVEPEVVPAPAPVPDPTPDGG